ncbi:MAG: hypothetical protein WAM91_08455 [Candidatus Acidiferrales bacterium]
MSQYDHAEGSYAQFGEGGIVFQLNLVVASRYLACIRKRRIAFLQLRATAWRNWAIIFPVALSVFFSLSGISGTKDPPWVTKDWTTWSSWDCHSVFYYSPWVWFDEGRGRETGPMITYNDRSTSSGVEIRLRSALPYRQALVRDIQIHKHYDRMSLQQKQIFDQQHAAELAVEDNDKVEITVNSLTYNALGTENKYKWPFPARRAALLLSDGTLVMPLQTTVPSVAYAYYVFPRTVSGKPIYTTTDKNLTIVFGDVVPFDEKHKELGPQKPGDFRLDPSSFRYDFAIPSLMYKGKLEY